MAKVTEQSVREILSRIKIPGQDRDIAHAGMVTALSVKMAEQGAHVSFALEIDPAHAADMEPLRQQAEKAVHDMPGVLSVTAVLTAHRAGPAMGARQMRQRMQLEGIRHIIAVASGKGGVGKSTTSVNLALALRAMDLRVGLLDADIYGPSVPRLLAIREKPDVADNKKLQPIMRHDLAVMSMGFLIEEETPMIWRGPMVQSAIQQMLRDVNWGALDVLVVDMPPGTGDAQLTMAQQVPLAGAVIVSTPQDIALLDARKGLNMFRRVDVPVLGIVENMSTFICPHCGERSDIFGHGGAREEAARLACPFLGEIPLDIRIRTSSDEGMPVMVADANGPLAQNYRDIATAVWRQLDKAQRPAPKIVME